MEKQLQNGKFYWIKWNFNSEWEICKYVSENNRFKATNGSWMEPSSCLEINYNPIAQMSSVKAEGVSDALKKEYSQMIYLGQQSICKEKCHCHVECTKAEELSDKFEADFNRMLSPLDEKEKEVEKFKEWYEELKTDLGNKEDIISEQDLQINSLQSELSEKDQEIERLNTALKFEIGASRSFSKDLKQWQESYFALQSELEAVKKEVILNKDNGQYLFIRETAEYKELQSELEATKKDLQICEKLRTEQLEQNSNMCKELEAVKQTNSGKFGLVQLLKNQKLEKEIEELKSQAEKMQTELDSWVEREKLRKQK